MTGRRSDSQPFQLSSAATAKRVVLFHDEREIPRKWFKDAGDPLKLVLVRDMWLTGFDVPCLHSMYVDKPMRGHGLMQAIARVNRVFKDERLALRNRATRWGWLALWRSGIIPATEIS